MPERRYRAEEIIQPLRTVEIEQAQGRTLEEAARKVGVVPQTILRWRTEYGGFRVDQARRPKELEPKNIRLKRVVANLALDISILK